MQSNLRLSTEPIWSDLIPRGGADIIISMEPMEALRYLPYLSVEGRVVASSTPFVNIPNYPDGDALAQELASLPRVCTIDIDSIAREAGAPKGANMALLGAASGFLGILSSDQLREAIKTVFAAKGDAVVDSNIKAFDAGLAKSVGL